MNIALGFGSTETEAEVEVQKAFEAFVESAYAKQPVSYLTDEFVKEIDAWARGQAAESQAAGKVHESAEDPPARYSYWWAHLASSASDLVLIVTFHHVNRRHALSPDGWGLMMNKRLFHISVSDMPSPVAETKS